MNRRTFLAQAGYFVPIGISCLSSVETLNAPKISVRLDPTHTVATVARDFMGLGYEISSVAKEGLLRTDNSAYLELIRRLGDHGVIRVGGNTSDYASYSATAPPVSFPEGKPGSVVSDSVLRDLGGLLKASGWQLIWGLNLGSGRLENAVAEARAVTREAKDYLLAFEIGNEPDLFAHAGHRGRSYGYADYLREFRTYRDALRKEIPGIPVAGPDVAGATGWIKNFADDESKDIKLLTHHYYRDSARNPDSTIAELLHGDPKLPSILEQLKAASNSCAVPYRICETNSFSGGGRPGVSDTFAAALWVLDFMFTLAFHGCAGVNLETGVNQLGFISWYSPIADDGHGHYAAAPEYYGMLAFAQAGANKIVGCTLEANGRNMNAYATQPDRHHIVLTIINKEPYYDATVFVDAHPSSRFRAASAIRLLAPSLESKSGVTLGGATVSASGSWEPRQTETLAAGPQLNIDIPRASAAIIKLQV